MLDNPDVSKGEDDIDMSDTESLGEIDLNQFPESQKEWMGNIRNRMNNEFDALYPTTFILFFKWHLSTNSTFAPRRYSFWVCWGAPVLAITPNDIRFLA